MKSNYGVPLLKTFFAIAFAISLFVGGSLRAESGLNPALVSMIGPMMFGQSGGAFLPLQVLNGLKGGNINPIMQFVIMNHMFDGCIVDSVKRGRPGQRESFIVADAKFRYGICKIKKCYEQGMLIGLLPGLSSKTANGGGDAADQQATQTQGLAMAMAFKKDPSCDGKDKQNGGMDPNLLMMFAGQMLGK